MNRYIFYSLLLLFAYSCSDSLYDDVETLTKVVDHGELNASIQDLGFDISDVQIKDEYVIVEGDIALPIKQVLQNNKLDSNKKAHFSKDVSGNWLAVDYNIVGDILVFIDPSYHPATEENILEAMNRWSSIQGCAINLERTLNVNDAQIKIDPTSVGCTCAEFPFNGNPGEFVQLPNPTNLRTAMHEIGHALGFAHINFDDGSYYPAGYDPNHSDVGVFRLPCTRSSDYHATMDSSNPKENLSSDEKKASRLLYPRNLNLLHLYLKPQPQFGGFVIGDTRWNTRSSGDAFTVDYTVFRNGRLISQRTINCVSNNVAGPRLFGAGVYRVDYTARNVNGDEVESNSRTFVL